MKSPLPQQIEILLHKLNHPAIPVNKIALPAMEGLQMSFVDSVISCASHSKKEMFLKKLHPCSINTFSEKLINVIVQLSLVTACCSI